MCGGAWDGGVRNGGWQGLSPRVRGSPLSVKRQRIGHGSIPACAGSLARPTANRGVLGSIPACAGEPPPTASARRSSRGLSPRVRGSPVGPVGLPALPGSIPACAGEPGRPGRTASAPGSIPACAGEPARRGVDEDHRRVYPRVCGGARGRPGERHGQVGLSPRVRGAFATSSIHPPMTGLSPRVRGSPAGPADARQSHGSIPACAGEPTRSAARPSKCRVYPRVCGGAKMARIRTIKPEGLSPRVRGGLSPRVRGSQLRNQRLDRVRGSIPACAGEPAVFSGTTWGQEVYPRVCGGADRRRRIAHERRGPSPRVRGSPRQVLRLPASEGSIPACAGEPRTTDLLRRVDWVYPRVCGGASIWTRLIS